MSATTKDLARLTLAIALISDTLSEWLDEDAASEEGTRHAGDKIMELESVVGHAVEIAKEVERTHCLTGDEVRECDYCNEIQDAPPEDSHDEPLRRYMVQWDGKAPPVPMEICEACAHDIEAGGSNGRIKAIWPEE